MKPNEHSKWRDFLRPLVEAAVTALAVYAAGLSGDAPYLLAIY